MEKQTNIINLPSKGTVRIDRGALEDTITTYIVMLSINDSATESRSPVSSKVNIKQARMDNIRNGTSTKMTKYSGCLRSCMDMFMYW